MNFTHHISKGFQNFGGGYTSAITHTMAHELGHGVYRLQHTFDYKHAEEDKYKTDNLMDYNQGDFLAHYQWRIMQDSVMFVWKSLQDDEDGMVQQGEYVSDVSIIITEIEDTNYGFDIIMGSNENYISVETGMKTAFHVSSAQNKKLYFTMENEETNDYSLIVDSTKFLNKYEITILSNNDLGSTSALQIHIDSVNGMVVEKLTIKSYKRVDTDMYIYGVNCDVSDMSCGNIQELFDQGVIKIRDFKVQNCTIDFDVNKNGVLDIYTKGNNPEMDMLKNSNIFGVDATTRDLAIAVIGVDVHRSYRLKRPINTGDTVVVIEHDDYKLKNNLIKRLYIGANSLEFINIKRVSSDTLYLRNAIVNNYPDSVLLWRGLSGLSSSPQIVKLRSKDLKATIVHERLHKSPFNLLDLEEDSATNNDNIMLFYSGYGRNRIRNRNLKVRGKNEFENQWDKIKR